MNSQPPPHESDSPWELKHVPRSQPPAQRALTNRVMERQRHRRRHRVLASISMLAAFLLTSIAVHRRPVGDENGLREATRQQIAKRPAERSATPTVATRTEGTSLSTRPTELPFRVYAEIRTDLPVFQFDDRQDAMVPVGFVRSSGTVPVELGPLNEEQVETFQAILRDQPTQFDL